MKKMISASLLEEELVECNKHPDAPHGFARNSSYMMGRYVCECEGWIPDECVKYPDDDEEGD